MSSLLETTCCHLYNYLRSTLKRLDIKAYLRNGDARQELVELLIVPDGELQMTWDDARLLVVSSRIACISLNQIITSNMRVTMYAISF
jgi:hypothetical protein